MPERTQGGSIRSVKVSTDVYHLRRSPEQRGAERLISTKMGKYCVVLEIEMAQSPTAVRRVSRLPRCAAVVLTSLASDPLENYFARSYARNAHDSRAKKRTELRFACG